MELALLLVEQVASMMILLAIGLVMSKSGLIKKGETGGLTSLILYVFSPCMILQCFQIEFDPQKFKGWLFITGFALATHLLFIALGRFVFLRKKTERTITERMALTYTNAGSVAMALIGSTMGREAMFYCSGYLLTFNFLIWTHGIRSISGGHSKLELKRLLLNPNVLSILVGVTLFLTNTSIPGILGDTVDTMGSMLGPLIMVNIGIIMGQDDLKVLFTSWRTYFICFLRLLVLPIILILVFWATGASHWVENGQLLLTVLLLAASSPVGTMIAMLTQKFGNSDGVYASHLASLSSVLCIFTMPLMALLGQALL